jgi:hypothetical protein
MAEEAQNVQTVIRSYKLRLYGNTSKADTARYTYESHKRYVQQWAGMLFFNGNKPVSTEGLGMLANQAQHKARGIVRSLRASAKETGTKTNIPEIRSVGCPATICARKCAKSFDYWVSVANQWTKCKKVSLPCKSHKALNRKLRNGWSLGATAELAYSKNGVPHVRVFVEKQVARAKPGAKMLGVDVGYKNAVSRSDGYQSFRMDKVVRRVRQADAERRRQAALRGVKFSKKSVKTSVKQLLDIEAHRTLARCERGRLSLAVEYPRTLANLGGHGLQGWAQSYFANRCIQLGEEISVWVHQVNPAYTSQDCSSCNHRDKRSRCGRRFECTRCGYAANADINAAINIAAKGALSLERYLDKRSGNVSERGSL